MRQLYELIESLFWPKPKQKRQATMHPRVVIPSVPRPEPPLRTPPRVVIPSVPRPDPPLRTPPRVVIPSVPRPDPPLRTVGAGDLVLVMPQRSSPTFSSLGTGRLGTGRRERSDAIAQPKSTPSLPSPSTKFSVKRIDE